MIGLIHNVIGSFHVCYVYRGALRRLMHTEVCIGLDIAHFPSLMYGFIMQQVHIKELYIRTYVCMYKEGKASIHTYVCKSGPRSDLKSVEYPFLNTSTRY